MMRLEAARCAYLPPSMVEIGEVDTVNRMVDVCIYPDNHVSHLAGRSAEDVGKHAELSMQPGVQHILASQLAGQVFEQSEHSTPQNDDSLMRKTQVLKHAVWAQCIKEPGNLRTRKVVSDMIGPEADGSKIRVEEIREKKADKADKAEQAGNRGSGLVPGLTSGLTSTSH